MLTDEGAPGAVRATRAIKTAFTALLRPPFVTIWGLALLIAVVSGSIRARADDATLIASIVLALVSLYLEIAVILAAGRREPERSADTWIKGAFRRRCFWRFFLTGLVVDVSVLLGLLGLVVGAFIVASMLGLAAPASVIERRLPRDAIARSYALTAPARRAIGTVYGLLVLIPTLALQGTAFTDLAESATARIILGCIGASLTTAGMIALTRMFTALGGERTPSPNDLKPLPPSVPDA